MPRIIDAEKLEEYKASGISELTEWQKGWNDAIDTIMDMDETPTVDAVPVVRCKDCIYSNGTLEYCSIDHWVNKDGTSFCSYGERKEDDKIQHP